MEKKPFRPAPRPSAPKRPVGAGNGPRGPRRPPERNAYPNNINEYIRAREVRLVGDNVTPGIYSIQEAQKIADELELDLVEISSQVEPPECNIFSGSRCLLQVSPHAH